MSEIDTEKVMSDINKTAEAMKILLQNNHHESFLILLYSWLDRMAWLSVEAEASNGNDFKNWVNKYLLKDKNFPCNADDLWAARCGVLHTGAAEANDTRSGKAKVIYYYGGNIDASENNNHQKVFVNLKELHIETICAAGVFVEHLKRNPNKLVLANIKLGRVLSRVLVSNES
ncbi:hypothetical protein I5N29_03610 [Serratia marcescens]|nr:hypothetical protein [Serratia marcescens]